MGGGPTPLACTRSPQKGWSPKKGTTVVGHCGVQRKSKPNQVKLKHKTALDDEASTAAFRPAAVVPAPP